MLIAIFIVIFSSMGFDVQHFKSDWAQRILVEFQGVRLTLGGVLMGLTLVLRLVVVVVSASLISTTTRLEDVIAFAKKIRIPYGLVIAFIVALRLIPIFMNELNNIVNGLKARGVDIDKGSFIQRLRKRYLVMSSIIMIGVRRSEELGIALQVRGFGASRSITILYDTKLKPTDYTVILATVVAIAACVYLRLVGYGVL